jgi:hypothetical protein
MKYLIDIDAEGWQLWLTTEHPASRGGIPVLALEGKGNSIVFTPDIQLSDSKRSPAWLGPNLEIVRGEPRFDTAGQFVADWGSEIERTDDEVAAARRFCESFPEGPQVRERGDHGPISERRLR